MVSFDSHSRLTPGETFLTKYSPARSKLHHKCYARSKLQTESCIRAFLSAATENEGCHVSVARTPAQCDRLCRLPRRCDLSQAGQERRRAIALITSRRRARLYRHTEEHKRSHFALSPNASADTASIIWLPGDVRVDLEGNTWAGKGWTLWYTWASRGPRGIAGVRLFPARPLLRDKRN